MLFNSKVVALFSVFSTVSLASDVYSHFNDAAGAQIGTTNFDIGNDGCFSVANAEQVSFTQSGPGSTADGPYCLTGFSDAGCSGSAATQEFANVELDDGKGYVLNAGLADIGSYSWATTSC
jgi:hypothetical protein